MIISSRTPEGQPASCPLCGASVLIEPSVFIGDATCPRCGQLLWFVQAEEKTRLFDASRSAETKERIIGIIAHQLGVAHEAINNASGLFDELAADSLDVVELVMELEQELDEAPDGSSDA